MKKLIDIRLQKKLLFVPILNNFLLFVWGYNYKQTERVTKNIFFAVGRAFLYALPMALINMNFGKYNFYLSILLQYLTSFLAGLGLIHHQEKYFFSD